MLVRPAIYIAIVTSFSACVDSQRLRSNLGAPLPVVGDAQGPSKRPFAIKPPGPIALGRTTDENAGPRQLDGHNPMFGLATDTKSLP